jgi:hypothetical protein
MPSSVVAALGASDCERIGTGFLAQPVNAVSSLAFVAAGAMLLRDARRKRLRGDAALVGAVTIAVGVGSAAFHGLARAPWGWAHDAALLSLVSLVAVRHLRASGLRPHPTWAVHGSALAFSALLPLAVPNATNAAVLALVATALTAERIGRSRSMDAVVGAPVAATFAVGLAALALGRTGAPLCRPESLLQLHALWHVLAATGTMAWARRAFRLEPGGHDHRVGADGA